jgi:hypothetical protein
MTRSRLPQSRRKVARKIGVCSCRKVCLTLPSNLDL